MHSLHRCTVSFQTFFPSAMLSRPLPEVLRVPSSAWSGCGFSHSSPSAALKEQLKKEHMLPVSSKTAYNFYLLEFLLLLCHFLPQDTIDSDCWKHATPDSVASPSSSTFPSVSDLGVGPAPSSGNKGRESPFSSSSYLDSIPSSSRASISSMKATDLTSLLISIGMEKYIRELEMHHLIPSWFYLIWSQQSCFCNFQMFLRSMKWISMFSWHLPIETFGTLEYQHLEQDAPC